MNALTEKKIQEFKTCAIELEKFDKDLCLTKEEIKRNKYLSKRVSALSNYFYNKDLDEFIKLLDDEDIAIAEITAECLYPLYPKKCMRIFKKYLASLNGDLEKHRMEILIEALVTKNSLTMDAYRRTFNCDDLSTLNREKKMR